MKDLDQFKLRELALNPTHVCELDGVVHCAVPLELLLRVTREFDVKDVRDEIRPSRFRR